MNDLLQQLLTMGPGIGAAVGGNGNAMAAFMDGYQRTMAQMSQQQRLSQQDTRAEEDRQRLITRQTEADTVASQQRKQQDFIQSQQAAGQLTQTASNFDDPMQAKSYIESQMPNLMSVFGQQSMALGQPAVEQATQMITGRQKKQVEDYLTKWEKSDIAQQAQDADPEIQLPEHLSRLMGRPQARLSELQTFAQLPVGRPQRKPSEDVSLQRDTLLVDGVPTVVSFNPKTNTYTDQTGKVVKVAPIPPRPTAGADPEIAELRKELLRLQVQNAGQEKEPNQAQFTSAGYAGRMAQAEPILTKVAPSIVSMSLPSYELQTNSWFAKPTFQSADVQSYMQSARNFINAVLRRESGAVISPEEFREARQQYLPVAGDTPETLAQKAANRQYVFDTMKRGAGKAYEAPITPAASHAPASPAKGGPKPKERRTINGQLAEWDGVGWLPVKP